jgi:tetratricopeptide (TPR) repeat protein
MFTAGVLAGCVASMRQVPRGQKIAEALLNGAIALLTQLGIILRSAEATIELACCYYREGLFELSRNTLKSALRSITFDEPDLKSLALIRLAILERHAGRLSESLEYLNDAALIVESMGPWATGRYHQELATTLRDLAIREERLSSLDVALKHYDEAYYQFQAIGNHRYAAAVENNHGHLLLALRSIPEAKPHLLRARKLFDSFADKVKRAQVEDTLARLHIATGEFETANELITSAVSTLELGGEEALLAEALTTQGLVWFQLGRFRAARQTLERAFRAAEHCGDSEGACRPLLIMIERMSDRMADDERLELINRLNRLLIDSHQSVEHFRKYLDLISPVDSNSQ